MSHCTNSGTKTGRKLLFFGRVRFQLREEEQQQQQEQQEGSMSHYVLIVQTAVQKMVENYCFSRVSEGTLGSFWVRFWRCSVLQGHCVSLSGSVRFSASGGRAAAATGAAGGFYVSLCLIVQTAVQKIVENYCFSRVSEGTLGSFWARFWRRSVRQGHCVSLSGSGAFSAFGRKSSSSNRSSRRVLCPHYVLIVQTAVQKMVENYCFSRVSEGTLGSFWARFWRRSVLQGHCVSLSGSVRFSASGGRAAAATGAAGGFYVSLCLIAQTAVQKLVENYCFSRVSEGTLGSFWGSILAPFRPSGPLCFPVRQRAFSASGGRAAAATGAAGGFYVSLCLIVTNSGTKTGRKLLFF